MTVSFMIRRPFAVSAFLAALLFLLVSPGFAVEVTWIPLTGGNWFTAGDWSGGAVPGVQDDVSVDNGPDPVVVSGSAASARDLFVGRNGFGSLFISGTLSSAFSSVGGEFGAGSVTVAGAASSWSGVSLSIGSSTGTSSLTVRDGGAFSTVGFLAGTGQNSPGRVAILVSGSASRLAASGPVNLNSETLFTVENGGSADINDLRIRTQAGMIVSGEDSRLDVNQLNVLNDHTGSGLSGSPAVWIKDGAAMSTSSASTVDSAGSSFEPTLRISGTGSRWDSEENIVLNAGSSLSVEQGGLLVTRSVTSGGTILLAGGTLQGRVSYVYPPLDTFIAEGVGVSLNRNGGGTVDTRDLNLSITGNIFGEGSLTKVGSGTLAVTRLTNSGSTFVRDGALLLDGSGDVASGIYVGVANGETASVQTLGYMTADLYIGYGAGSTGSVGIEGFSAPSWNNGNKTLVLGESGIGLFSLTSGQFLTDFLGSVILGNQADGRGDFQLAGSAASASVGSVSVGRVGQGTLTVSDGASFTVREAFVGYEAGSNGVLLVSGSNGSVSHWNANAVWIGLSGTGGASVGEGGVMQATVLRLGGESTGQGLIQILSGGTLRSGGFSIPSEIGGLGEGILRVDAGGSAEVSNGLTAGLGTTGVGWIDVTGTGARLVATTPGGEDTVVIGDLGFGRLAVMDGGTYLIGQLQTNTINTTVLGRSAGGMGAAIVSGEGSVMSGTAHFFNNSQLVVGQFGTGDLTVKDGGRVAFGTLTVAEKAGSTGIVRLNEGGILEVYESGTAAGDGTIVFNGGTVRATSAAGYGFLGNVRVELAAGGSLDANERILYVEAPISGTGNLTLANTGTVIFSGANTYSGTTFVNHGTLRSGSANTFSAASTIVLGDAPEVALEIEHDQTVGAIMGGASVSINNSTLSLGANDASFTLNAGVSGNGALAKVGSGTMSLTNTNTYAGGTHFRGGAVEFGSLANFGDGGLTFDGGALRFAPGNTSDISTRAVTFAEGGAVIDTNGNTVLFANSIGNGGAGSLTKAGAGRLILGGSNTFTGDAIINGGILEVSNPNALAPDSAVIFADTAGAGLDVRAGVQRLGSISGGGAAGGDISLGSLSQVSVGSANTSTTYGGKITADEGINGASLRKVGTGTLTLTGGLNFGGLFIDDGTVTLDGASANIAVFTAWTRLELRNGANLGTSYVSAIGIDPGRNGEMLVTGADSVWRSAAGVILVGAGSYGTLTIADGGEVAEQAGGGRIVLGQGLLGTLNIGEYNTPTAAGTLQAAVVEGSFGRGLVNFNHTGSTTFAANLTGLLDVNQRGPGLTVLTGSSSFSGALNTNSGTLQISNGGSVTSTVTSGIATTGTTATLIVTGSGANWTSLADTLIGHNGGTGSLLISDGATVGDTFSLVGRTAGGAGHVTVSGPGSAWTHSAGLVIGTGGTGTMLVENGGQVTNADGIVGGDAGSSGAVRVTGPGSQWASNSYLVVGNSGTGILNVDGGVVVRVGASGSGVLTLGNAGAGSGILNIGAAAGQPALAPGVIQASVITGGSGSGAKVVNFNHAGTAYTFAPHLTGSLRVQQNGGTTILTGSNSYEGGTCVNAGTLAVGHNSALGAGAVNVNGGVLLILEGYDVSNIITLSGGSLARQIGSVTELSALSAYIGNLDGGVPTGARFLDGETSAATTLAGSFTPTSSALNDSTRSSDVFHLGGVPVVDELMGATDTFVLQLELSPEWVTEHSYLAWLNPATNRWVNAVEGNFGGTATFVLGAYNSATDFHLGTYGVDTEHGVVWAVLNHNSDFSVVPEPSTWGLIGFGLTMLLIRQRSRKLRA